jgi:hypothetical protein
MSIGLSSEVDIGRFDVGWRVDADLDAGSRSRLDDLVRDLQGGPLQAALSGVSGWRTTEICVRRIVVPPHHTRWECADTELVSQWAGVIGHAVRAAVLGTGDEVVRFTSRTHARADLVVSVLRGDRERAWAWQLLGLWPEAGWSDSEAVLRTVTDSVVGQPGALVGLAVAAARAGKLERFIACIGEDALAEHTLRAWSSAGGAGKEPGSTGSRTAPWSGGGVEESSVVARLAAVVHKHSEILEQGRRLFAGAESRALVRHGIAGSPSPYLSGFESGSLVRSLAALALLEVEPVMAANPAAPAAVTAVALGLLPSSIPGGLPIPGAVAELHEQDLDAAAESPAATAVRTSGDALDAARSLAESDSGGIEMSAPSTSAANPPVSWTTARAGTSWGGLLFLAPVIGALGIPARVTAEPGTYGVGLRPVLHQLGGRLVARAAPDAEPVDQRDPGLLAFCGLGPDDEVPESPDRSAGEQIDSDVEAIIADLRRSLLGPDDQGRSEAALLLSVCRRQATVEAVPGWLDVELRLDEVSVDIRRAGLDLDPGYLPWLGCIVKFRYV